MSNSKRLSVVVSAISALTLADLESFTNSEVQSFRDLARSAKCKIDASEKANAFANMTPERERTERERLAFGSHADRVAFFDALPTVRGLSPLEAEEAKNGRKIMAIKLHRERTNMGLADSKNTVEASGFCAPSQPYA